MKFTPGWPVFRPLWFWLLLPQGILTKNRRSTRTRYTSLLIKYQDWQFKELIGDAIGPCYTNVIVANDSSSRVVLILFHDQFCNGPEKLNRWCEAIRRWELYSSRLTFLFTDSLAYTRAHFTWLIGFTSNTLQLCHLAAISKLVVPVCFKDRSSLALPILQSSTALA